MEISEQPNPLVIIKRDSNASFSSLKHGHSGQRKFSSDTDESQEGEHKISGMDLPLTVLKKRGAMLSRHGERFNAGASAAAYRRAMNRTDNLGNRDSSGSDSGSEGGRSYDAAGADGLTSVRLRYLQDGQIYGHEHKYREDSASGQPRSSEQASLYFDGIDTFHSERAEAEAGAGEETNEAAGYPHQMGLLGCNPGTPQTERLDALGSACQAPSDSGKRCDMLRGCPSPMHATIADLSNTPASFSSTRLVSTDIRLEDETVSPSPFERPATAAPFRSQGQHHQHCYQHQYYQHHTQNPHALPPIRPSLHYSVTETAPDPNPDPRMLTPIITITPERRSVGGSANRFWVAVELHAQVTRPLDGGFSREYPFRHSSRQFSAVSSSSKDNAGLYRYGYISDMNIEIYPSGKSEILEVIGKSPSLITLLPGSRRLLVVHIQLNTNMCKSQTATSSEYWVHHQRQKSDRLIEDLEHQLGATPQEYMHVQLTYTHSGFPKRGIGRDVLGHDGGCVSVRTTIETTATAVIMQQNASSPWSPPPPPSSSPLSEIVARHWGPAAAADMVQRMAATSAMRMLRKSANPMRQWDSMDNLVAAEDREKTPERADSGEREEVTPRASSHQLTASQAENSPLQTSRAPTPAGRIWKQIRRVSSTGLRSASRQHAQPAQGEHGSSSSAKLHLLEDSPPPGCFPPRPKNVREPLEGLRQAIPDTAPRAIKRPVGTDTTNLQSLSHRMSEVSLHREKARERQPNGNSHNGLRNSSSRSSSMSKSSGKWSWTGWFT